MNIGIDGNEANVEKGVGINTYALNILRGLSDLNKSGNHNYTIFLKEKPYNFMPIENKKWKYKVLKAQKMWIISSLTPYLWFNFNKYDLFFTPSHYIPPFVPVKRICSIMDLGYLENSAQFGRFTYWQLKYWTAYSILASSKILTISAQSASDIVRHYQIASKKTKITLLGYDQNIFNSELDIKETERVKNKYNIVNNYLLFLSTLKPSKNIERLVEAWSKIENKHLNFVLVIGGKKGWLYESIFSKIKELNIESRVVFTDFVDEKDKPSLIKGAKAFILPSLWEGFGLDVLSALACGVPVIVSNVGSLPEVAGSAAMYINPYKVDSIAQGIEKVLNLKAREYNKLVKTGLAQANKFSWERTAQETLEVLESLDKK